MATNRDAFDHIAPGWYNFRHWSIFPEELKALSERWRRGRLLNLGCAHGPDFLPFRENFELYGVDFSPGMIEGAKRYSYKFGLDVSLLLADVCYLPFADGSFDWAISIATYHHLKGQERHLAVFGELQRVLKSGAEAFVTVWNRWQRRFFLKGKEVTVPWRTGERIFHRYYYLFDRRELEKLALKSGFEIVERFPGTRPGSRLMAFSPNICLLLRKR